MNTCLTTGFPMIYSNNDDYMFMPNLKKFSIQCMIWIFRFWFLNSTEISIGSFLWYICIGFIICEEDFVSQTLVILSLNDTHTVRLLQDHRQSITWIAPRWYFHQSEANTWQSHDNVHIAWTSYYCGPTTRHFVDCTDMGFSNAISMSSVVCYVWSNVQQTYNIYHI